MMSLFVNKVEPIDNSQHERLAVYSVCSSCVIFSFTWILFFFFSSKIFCNHDKTVLREGDILKFPKLAETMEIIAEQGADAFYTGKIGQDLIKDIKDAGWCNLHRQTGRGE